MFHITIQINGQPCSEIIQRSKPSERELKQKIPARATFSRRSLFRLIQMLARRQVGEWLEVFRAERFGNDVFAAEPFAEINQLAPVRAERTEFSREPVAGLFARRAFDCAHGGFYWLAMTGACWEISPM
jgi:hypothetical protein